ncbi:MAG: hypothetical protein DDT32_01143 [Syntrophomonadaceae bacterium]|nr:hypothetical protein [Bacillota bacterium]
MGAWSITIILSICSFPEILSYSPEPTLARCKMRERAFSRVSTMRVDFPEPETPVTQVKTPIGICTFMFFRLFSLAPLTSRNIPFSWRLKRGTLICNSPFRYFPVRDCGELIILSNFPSATNQPPSFPAPGPRSIIWSALLIVVSSCSTTRMVFPRSRSRTRALRSLWLSRACNPIDGSSST